MIMRYIALLLAILATTAHGQGWNTNAYPAALRSDLPAFVVTHGIVSILGSTGITNGSTEWHFNTTNKPTRTIGWFLPTNGVWDALCEQTSIYIKTYPMELSPTNCSQYWVVTNSVVRTNSYFSIVCSGVPANNPTFSWSNSSTNPDCSLLNTPQLIAVNYSVLTTNGSKFFPNTNANLKIESAWIWDASQATGERLNVLGLTNAIWQRFAVDIHSTVFTNLPMWKRWVLDNSTNFVISAFTNSTGFNDYCATPQTGRVWTTRSGLWWDGLAMYSETNAWRTNITYRETPCWTNDLYLDVNTNLTSIPPYQFASPLSMKAKLSKVLGLPLGLEAVIITNTGTFDGYSVGLPYVHTTNTSQVVTALFPINTYFDYTPDLHGATRGHLVTNVWTFNNQWLTWGNLSNVVTNTLRIAGNTFLNVAYQFWSNGWTNASSVMASNSALYTLQIAGFTNWLSTNIVGGVTNLVQNTNTYSVAFNGFSLSYDSRTWTITNAITNTLWSIILSNSINSTNLAAVFTNYNVASGWLERDYEFDGIKTCLNDFTKVAQPITWVKNPAAFAVGRYGTNYVYEIVDTNYFGSLWSSPTQKVAAAHGGFLTTAIIVTDSFESAKSTIVFTNSNNYGASSRSAPWGYSYGFSVSTNTFRKDVWYTGGWTAASAFPETVYVCNTCTNIPYPVAWPYCTTDEDCAALGYPDIPCGSIPQCRTKAQALAACEAAAAGGVGVCYDIYPGEITEMVNDYQPIGYSTNSVTDCDSLTAAAIAVTNAPCNGGPFTSPTYYSDGNSFSFAAVGASYSFWHGSATPSDFAYCCDDGAGSLYAASVTWTKFTNDITDTIVFAYGYPGDPTNTYGVVGLHAPQQSFAGFQTDISKSYASARDVYLAGVLPSVDTPAVASYANWDTNSLPVPATIGSGTIFITNTPAISTNCVDAFAAHIPPVYHYRRDIQTFPLPKVIEYFYQAGSNFTCTVTNLTWPHNATWKAPSIWTGGSNAWDAAHGLGIYQRLSTATGSTNFLGVSTFLSPTPLLAPVLDNTPYGWGVGDGVLIIDYQMPHR